MSVMIRLRPGDDRTGALVFRRATLPLSTPRYSLAVAVVGPRSKTKVSARTRWSRHDRRLDGSDYQFHPVLGDENRPQAARDLLDGTRWSGWHSGTPSEAILGSYKPRAAQISMLSLPISERLAVIEAPTGSGKTEASLIWADRLVAAGLVDGMYFAVPTRSAATELHARISKLMGQVHPLVVARVVRAVPGMIDTDHAANIWDEADIADLGVGFGASGDGSTHCGGHNRAPSEETDPIRSLCCGDHGTKAREEISKDPAPARLREHRLHGRLRESRSAAGVHPSRPTSAVAGLGQGLGAAVPEAEPVEPVIAALAAGLRAEGAAQGHIAVNSILRDWIKGQVTAIECGILSFEAVFMPFMLEATVGRCSNARSSCCRSRRTRWWR